MTRKTRNKFSPEFKREAVRLLEESDKGVAQLAGIRTGQHDFPILEVVTC